MLVDTVAPPVRPVAGSPVTFDARSAYVIAQDGLDAFVDAAAQARRIEAMQQSVRVGIIHAAVEYAVQHADAFTSSNLSGERRHEMARRAVTSELATALRIAERTMLRLIDEAWSLCTQLPATLAALRAGEIDYTHARVIIDATTGLGDDERSRLDGELSIRAADVSPATLRRVARRLRDEIRAETLAERHAAALAERRLEFEPAADGMAWLHLHLDASDAMLICDRVDRVAADAADADDPRTPAQLRADVARDLLRSAVPPVGDAFHAAAATARPTVHVTVPVLTLLGSDDEPGDLDGYGPIAPEVARRLAAQAPSFTRLLTHPVDGVVLDLDRTVYRPPADLTRWLRVRDETCRFPGCNRRAVRCDLDHTDDFADGGRTAFDNLAHLCPGHHHLKHESAWSVRHRADGVLEWRSLTGRTYVTTPATSMRALPRGATRAARFPDAGSDRTDRDPNPVGDAPPTAALGYPPTPPF
ncbi:HNH endonuclease signature motif containing protein [Agromyces larvae]|uniref:HNH endonuclease n=1 Tax=Agromyces larvae TaxID=2929802 RepID=A0ABY4C2V6_9MICO|nr:HNH endonuclease signature motif containing protein [Agromyces larvae]UOE45772.1 HNH endonuclease [Agromyces larvae]